MFSGSLWLAMVFHVYFDLNQGQLMTAVLERTVESQAAAT